VADAAVAAAREQHRDLGDLAAIAIASWPAPDSRSKRGRPARSTAGAPAVHQARRRRARRVGLDQLPTAEPLDAAPRADGGDAVQDVLDGGQAHRVVGGADVERQLAAARGSR
jgi:hypothetical protein